ncbi:MAG: type I DNA topoisomerase, partial [Mogibacterium sp.]|nr:type I DNA topoisomerase [Mogibacterium sp.]
LNQGTYAVEEAKKGTRKVKPFAPFTTSSLQQDASIRLGFQTRKTMQIAQELYEGVNIKGVGARGLITYLRTDSVRVSGQARAAALGYIEEKYGKQYQGGSTYTNKKKDIQDAHEAIRPSDISLEPAAVRDSLTADQYKLYDLIWRRFAASQMAPAVYDTTSVGIRNGRYEFRASGSTMKFDGWRKVYSISSQESEMKIPELEAGQILEADQVIKEKKFTQPPPRYTEASLVKEMEESNIGRPSTYAAIITTLTGRSYVKREKKNLVPTKLGFDVNGLVSHYFKDIVDLKFTGRMEDELDDIELQKHPWKDTITRFYGGFREELKVAEEEAERIEQEVVLSDEVCELCGKPMAVKEGQYGKFLACTGYPECKNTRPFQKGTGIPCPVCGKEILERRGRKSGKIFYGCSGFPECNVLYWDKPTGRMCPVCGSMIVKYKGKTASYKCSNKECKYREK